MVGLQYRQSGILGAVLPSSLRVSTAMNSSEFSPKAAIREVMEEGKASATSAVRTVSPCTDSAVIRTPSMPPSHYVITPSTKLLENHFNVAKPPVTAQSEEWRGARHRRRFIRLEDLPGEWLSTMLQMAATMTSRSKSYTFHSVPYNSQLCGGYRYLPKMTEATPATSDTCTTTAIGSDEVTPKAPSTLFSAPSSSAAHQFVNSAILHIVSRTQGDIPINNLIYTHLISQCSIVVDPAHNLQNARRDISGSAKGDGTDANARLERGADAEDKRQGNPSGDGCCGTSLSKPCVRNEESDEDVSVGLSDRYTILSGAASLECPRPNALLSEDTQEGERRRRLIAAEDEHGAEEEGRVENDSDACRKRAKFSMFMEALQSDVRIGDKDLSVLPQILSPSLRAKDAVGEEQANAANLVVTSPKHPPQPHERTFYFWPYKCDYRSSVAYESTHFVVLVNLKPITKGHLMVVPRRVMPTIHSLSNDEFAEWGFVVRHCALVLRRVYPEGQGISLAIQQGAVAGQTVPHLHTHVIVYREDGELSGEPEPEEVEQLRRRPRTHAEMQDEADSLRKIFIELETLVGEKVTLADI